MFTRPVLCASIALPLAATLTHSQATPNPATARPLALAPGAVRWVATTGVATPWIFDLIITDSTVAGVVRQRAVGAGGFSVPYDVRDGRARGDSIWFTLLFSGGDRVITFEGRRWGAGDSLELSRSVNVVRGSPGGNGVVGASGATHVVARRFAADALLPGANVVVALDSGAADGPRQKLNYKNFTVDYTAIASHTDRDSALAAVRVQLDLVLAAVPSAELRRFFETVPLEIAATDGTARYGGGRVVIPEHSTAPLDRAHPVLLHELCHAYHQQRLPGGVENADILSLYQQAMHSGRFPMDSYMLSRPGEYFAMMASVYLAGSAAREPYARDSIKLKQPEMYAWLRNEFGPRE